MQKGNRIFTFSVLLGVLLLVGLGLWWSWNRSPSNIVDTARSPAIKSSKKARQKPTTPAQLPQHSSDSLFSQIDPNWPQEEKSKEWNRRMSIDRSWEWKIPINFYGKVVDENGEPVQGVQASLIWNDLSPTEGTSTTTVVSDAQGLFSLTGTTGKHLQVRITKEGYYSFAKNQIGFEYAAYFDPDYHYAPDPSRPVVFHLKKKGEVEGLVFFEREIPVSLNSPVAVDLIKGKTDSAGGHLFIEVVSNGMPSRSGNWSAHLRVPGGGIQGSAEEFPFLAPPDGYEAEIVITQDTLKPPAWPGVYQGGGLFFIKTPEGYGRVEIRMIPGKSFLRLLSWFNPSGSRNLEYDKGKAISLERIAKVGLERAIEEAKQRRPKTAEEEAEERRRLQGQPMGTAPE